MKGKVTGLKKITIVLTTLLIIGSSFLAGCSGELARRADGTCVFFCSGDTGTGA